MLLLGGRSEIGLAVAERLVRDGARAVVLAARGPEALTGEVERMRAAGASRVQTAEFDADDVTAHGRLLADVVARHIVVDAVVTSGVLGDQARAEQDVAHALAVVHTDFTAPYRRLQEGPSANVAAGRSYMQYK